MSAHSTAPNHADSERDLLYKLLLAVRGGFGSGNTEVPAGVTGRRLVVRRTTPLVSTSPDYSVGDCVGGAVPLLVGSGAELGALSLVDRDDQYRDFEVLFFAAPIPAFDNTVFVWLTLNRSFLGRVRVALADFASVDGVASATLSGLNLNLVPLQGDTVYAVVVAKGEFSYSTDWAFELTFHLR